MSPDSLNLFFFFESPFFFLGSLSVISCEKPIFDMKPGGDADASRPDFTQRLQAANVSNSTALFVVVVMVVVVVLEEFLGLESF